MKRKYFKGLDAFRFFAAFLVLVMHSYGFFVRNIQDGLESWPIFSKGHTAVSFFFTLSGFLITYLLLSEITEEGRVKIRKFYLKRVFRIWPLYFFILFIGISVNYYFLPTFRGDSTYINELDSLVLFYSLFLSNYYNSFWQVGAILGVTWSISVEEQFYLFWAPLINFWKTKILLAIFVVFVTFFIVQTLNFYFTTDLNTRYFINMLQFQNMAIGGFFAYLLFNKGFLLNLKKILAKRITINITLILILGSLFLIEIDHYNPFLNFILSLIYGYLIYYCANNQDSRLVINNRRINKLGQISFGIYMYHSIMIYLVYLVFFNLPILKELNLTIAFIIFILAVSALTFITSNISYFYLERKFLQYAKKCLK